ncbi:MAG: succinate dehydrogenase/fumarate reductase iron-sulfur subunit [Lentisphaerae bacterium]|nr:succinate dehydrogenase/fumarate reductase iron-sulfur subunit [Lentisphaerota bacterium]
MTTNGHTYTLKVWRQPGADRPGRLATYTVTGISPDLSLLEALDVLNEDLIRKGEDPIAFESDCREGICGQCGIVVNGVAHGSKLGCTTCEIRMREFAPGSTITLEPFRATAFPIIKDLVINRSAFDRIIARGGYVSINTGAAPEANAIPVARDLAEKAMDAAACIGCGACVAACPNASASLFVGAKVSQLAVMPQGHAERERRVTRMVAQMDAEGFGNCSNHGECEAVCPKEIPIHVISRMRREYIRASVKSVLG